MTASNYPSAFAAMIKHEGAKYTDLKADRGGATKFGVTQATLSTWLKRQASKDEVKALTLDAVKPIYKAMYANAVRFDDLPPGLDYLAFDWAVNSGPAKAAKALQEALGVEADGFIGPKTIAAAKKAVAADPIGIVTRYADMRRTFFEAIIKARPSQAVFKKGWFARAAQAKKLALELAAPPKKAT